MNGFQPYSFIFKKVIYGLMQKKTETIALLLYFRAQTSKKLLRAEEVESRIISYFLTHEELLILAEIKRDQLKRLA